ncbi:alternative tryptophan synthase beta-subunit [Microbacterium trichothecenolyticum]|uniref:Uncharacterized protein n=1 Tax=Microbacterium trichothecenolyticum TaxID=69370 RepID=A0ABU0TSF1_MICTR|nr:alternative tryptophan synthase beta-subunit [Microbacterium trichothecenolyticum]MDQ1122589.1 hypothetical protein [Microbacterium trichothecenolyticum]
MTRPRTVTHTYTLDGGWQKADHELLTPEHAELLRGRGVTMVRARRGLFDVREVSLREYPPRGSEHPPAPPTPS